MEVPPLSLSLFQYWGLHFFLENAPKKRQQKGDLPSLIASLPLPALSSESLENKWNVSPHTTTGSKPIIDLPLLGAMSAFHSLGTPSGHCSTTPSSLSPTSARLLTLLEREKEHVEN